MYPRLLKDEKYFANLEGKRPPVPGKEDDFDTQCSNHKDHQFNALKSFTNTTPYNHLQDSKLRLYNLCKKGNHNLDGINIRENGVGETCDESAEIQKLSSNPISIQALSNPSFNKLECYDDVSHLSISPSKSPTTTTCLRWTEGLNSLLEDVEGLNLFRQFLEAELSGSSKVLDFVFSCRGLRLVNESDGGKLMEVVRLMHKRYIMKEVGVRLDPDVKKRVAEKIRKVVGGCRSENVKEVFEEALTGAEMFLEKEMYPQFLKSDFFLDFFQKESELIFNNNNNNPIINKEINIKPKQETKHKEIINSQNDGARNQYSDNKDVNLDQYSANKDQYGANKDQCGEDGGWVDGQRKPPPSPKLEESTSVIFGSSLPSLPEERELELTFDPAKQTQNVIGQSQISKQGDSQSINVLQLSSLSLLATRRTRQKHAEFSPINPFPYPPTRGKPSNPYHVSYAPGSAQDSELQSLSSDAQTEDTLSFTDSSLDGRLDMYMTRTQSYKKQARYIRHFAAKNHEANFPGRFIPRTECMPADCNLASTNPQVFASILIGKLQVVKENQEKVERIVKIMQGIQNSETTISPKDSPIHHHHHHQPSRSYHRNKPKQSYNNNNNNHHLKYNINNSSEIFNDDEPDSAQSILDDHVSQLWNSFGNSPNHFTPGLATPDGGVKENGDTSHHHPSYTNHHSDQLSCWEAWNCNQKNVLHCNAFNRHLAFDKTSAVGQNRINANNSNISTNSSELSTQKIRSSTEKSSTASHPPIMSSSRDHHHHFCRPFCVNQNSMFLSSTCQPNSGHVSGQMKNKQCPVRLPLYKTNLSNENPERLVNLKIQSSQSAFNRNVLTNHRKQASLNSSFNCDAIPHEIISVKNKHVDKKFELSKGPFVTSKICKPVQPDPNIKGRIQPDPNVANGQMARSKSLDRNKILATNKFNRITECNPDSMSRQLNMARENNLFDVSKLHPLPVVAPPPPQNKNKVQSVTQSSHSRKPGNNSQVSTIVGYYMQNEPIPYRIILPGQSVTLGQLKTAISKRENYRFFFKKLCSDFDTEVVHEEINNDDQTLPLWDGKVVCHIEKID